jgi:hypothetical protein
LSRFIDRGAVIAGWIGVGTAVVVVVAFGLVLPIQPIVYVAALPVGLLIGWYANSKAQRRRPRARAFANAVWAVLPTALTLAVFYLGIRLLFIYADNGYPDFNVAPQPTATVAPGQTPAPSATPAPTCDPGPACTYLRYLEQGKGAELQNAGVTNADEFGRFIVAEQLNGGLILFALVIAGGVIAGAWQAVRPTAPQEAAVSST